MRTLLTSFLFLTIPLFAQINTDKGSISGFVFDANSSPIEGAKVTAKSAATSALRETKTDERGAYHLSSLDAGSYDLLLDANSFLVEVKTVVLTVGADINVDIRTGRSSSGQRVEIDSPAVTVTNFSNTEVFGRDAIRDLPIDGRRFQDFASLAAGVQANAATRNELSFLGQIGIYANVMIDGLDHNEPFLGGIRGSERAMFAFTIPQSAIQEFQILTNGYSPEYGRSTSGILNAISRSGANSPHGDAFYQVRSHRFGVENPYGAGPSGSQQQLGGGAGGPIRKDRIFWFGAVEGQLASFPRSVRFASLDAIQNGLTSVTLPAYQYFRSLEGPYTQTNNAFAALAKVDYQFRGASRLSARVSSSRNTGSNATSSGSSWIPQTASALSSNGLQKDFIKTGALEWTSILPRLAVNDFRFSYSAEDRAIDANSFSPSVQAGIIGTFGTGSGLPASTKDSRLQFADSLTVQRGAHSFSFGTDYNLIRVNHHAGVDDFGTFLVADTDVGSVLSILSRSGGVAGNRFDDPSVIYRRQVGSDALYARAHQIAFFGQDEWRPNPALTLSFGLRWEGQINPSPAGGNSFLLQNVEDFNFPLGRVDPTKIRNQLNQWAPRLALAWNPKVLKQTVVRGSASILYGQTPLAFYADALTNFGSAGGNLSLQIAPDSNGTVYQQFAKAGIDLNQTSLGKLPVFTPSDVWMKVAGEPNQFAQANVFTTSANNFRNPRSLQFTLELQHQFAPGFLVSYQLNSLNTVHLPRVVDYNVPEPVVRAGDLSLKPFFGLRSGTARPNPNLGAVYVLDASARSTYLGHSVRLQYRTKNLELVSHFTLSYAKSDGEMQWPFVSTSYQNPFDFHREWGWSSLDSRYQSAGYALFHAPKGFEFSGVFRARSGLPIDALSGIDSAELLSTGAGDRPLQSPGMPFTRNSFRNLGYRAIDARALKRFAVRDSVSLQLSGEFFNLFNFNNIEFIPAVDYPGNPAFIYGPGVLLNGSHVPANPGFLNQKTAQGRFDAATTEQQGTPFQAQFGVRIVF